MRGNKKVGQASADESDKNSKRIGSDGRGTSLADRNVKCMSPCSFCI